MCRRDLAEKGQSLCGTRRAVSEAVNRISAMEGRLFGRFVEWEKCKSQDFDVPWWKALCTSCVREISENGSSTFGEGSDRGWVFAICDSEMFEASASMPNSNLNMAAVILSGCAPHFSFPHRL